MNGSVFISESLMSSLHLRAPRMRLIMESYNSAFVSIDGSLSRSSSHPPPPSPPSPPQVIFHPPLFFLNSSSSHLRFCSSSSQTAFKAICSATFLSSFSTPSHFISSYFYSSNSSLLLLSHRSFFETKISVTEYCSTKQNL